jgi:chromosome segregation ATPase
MISSGIRAEMEIARLTAICRKTDCGPLENEIARLRAQIRALEEGNGAQIKALEAEKADLQAEIFELKTEHKQEVKEIYDLYTEELQENMGQCGRILELEEENEKLKDEMAMMAMEGHVAGSGDEMSGEEQPSRPASRTVCYCLVARLWG